jgi:hypothetical protein
VLDINSEKAYNCYIELNFTGEFMQMLHTSLGKSKKRKADAKARQLRDDWEKMLKKYATKTSTVSVSTHKKLSESDFLGRTACRETPKIPSLPFSGAPCLKKASPVYTGTKVKGIGTMHKSNAVPIFSDEEAVAIATMRR